MEEKILNTKQILKNSLVMVYKTGIYLLLFELIYKGLILILFKPVLNMTVSVFLVYYEFAVILLILDSSKKKEKINLLQITETALMKLKKIIKKGHIGLALYILVLIPILNIGIQSSLVPTLSIPDFITGELSKYPGSEILILILGIALVYLFSKLFIVLPIMIFSGKSFKEASIMSFKTIKGEGFQIAFLIIVGMLIWVMLTYLPFLILENVEFILLRILRSGSNISMTIFTLLVSPFILSISLESYGSYIITGDLKREEVEEKIELGYVGRKVWAIVEKILALVQALILKAKSHMKIVIALTLVIIVALSIYSEESVKPLYDKQLLIGHRGGEYGVENTIETIMFAGNNGADYVEMDVLLTKDHVPVVIHDNSLKRLGKISKNISDLTLDEVMEITIAAGGKEANIPSLEELAKEVKGKTKLLLEFKTHGKEEASIIDKTIEILEKEGILEETIFHTAEDDIIREFNEKYEELIMGYVFIGKLGTFSAKKMANMPVDFISAEESLITKNMIREVHKAGKPVFAWTINEDYKAERLLELGVDGIITDYPVEMTPLRDQYKDYHTDIDIKRAFGL